MTYVVGFSGTQQGMTDAQQSKFCQEISIIQVAHKTEKLEFHHGDDVGSDAEADEYIRIFVGGIEGGWEIHIHPPLDEFRRAHCEKRGATIVYEPKKFLVRNDDIAFVSDILIAIVKERYEMRRSGTWSTVRRARYYNKRIIFIYPDGSTSDEQSEEK